ncbi:YrhA family protein [Vibrio ruber]|uniref:YrhA family protein n=1 Tax=Vibrio ruber TaxID=184755 RepID=UPI002892A9B3|nr:YrhA family protein [Vibrio ruber]WNJ94327.1 YrhA family protein [Vibrio ruber]
MSISDILSLLNSENQLEKNEYGEGFLLNAAEDTEIENLKKIVLAQFGIDVSSEYLEILKLSNGFSVNGFNLYGSKPYDEDFFIDGIVDINKEFWTEDSLRQYFTYGDESSTRLVYNMDSNLYEAVDNVTWEKLEIFHDFSDLLNYVFENNNIFDS